MLDTYYGILTDAINATDGIAASSSNHPTPWTTEGQLNLSLLSGVLVVLLQLCGAPISDVQRHPKGHGRIHVFHVATRCHYA